MSLQMSIGLTLRPGRSGLAEGQPPANTALPGISGTAQQGQTLTGSPGTWSGTAPLVFAYQWLRDGAGIAGATAAGYEVQAADVGAVISLRVTATNAAGSAQAGSAGTAMVAATLANLPVPPQARWHPAFSSVAQGGGRVVSASDLTGLAGLTEGAAGIGPKAMTDALGRRFWRFEGAEFLNVATALAGVNNRALSLFCVIRAHRGETGWPVFSMGNVAAGTAGSNTGGSAMSVAAQSNSAPCVAAHGRSAILDATNGHRCVVGSQLQVMGILSRTTANGATRLYLNTEAANVAQNATAASGLSGAEIGRNAYNPGASGSWGTFDLYEMIVYASGLTNAQGDAVTAALVAHWGIPAVTSQLVLEGDSITQGSGTVTSGISAGMLLTEPGTGRVPPGWRVVNVGSAGGQIANLLTRRDAAGGWASMLLAGGQNVLAFEIGRNDMGTGGLTAAAHCANVAAYLNSATTGVLQRGWTVRALANIAAAGTSPTRTEEYRALIRAPQFRTDTQTAAGQAFEGRLSILDTDQITDGGNSLFLTPADTADMTYYQGDNTNPSPLGALLRVTGGDTPAKGIAAGLA